MIGDDARTISRQKIKDYSLVKQQPVLILSYEQVRQNFDLLSPIQFGLMICDEVWSSYFTSNVFRDIVYATQTIRRPFASIVSELRAEYFYPERHSRTICWRFEGLLAKCTYHHSFILS